MNIINNINIIKHISFSIGGLLVLSACGTMALPNRMALVEQNISETRLVPARAVITPDVLNLYANHYRALDNHDLTINIDLDKPLIFNTGGFGKMQLAVTTRATTIAVSKIQFLFYDNDFNDSKHSLYKHITAQAAQQISQLPRGSSLKVDTAFKRPPILKSIASRFEHDDPDFNEFVEFYSQQDYSSNGAQIILLLGEIDTIQTSEKQDIIDMTRILSAKGVRISVLSYGESPDFAFYTKIAEVGQGFYRIHNDTFNTQSWLENELNALHSVNFSDLKIAIKTNNGIAISKILSPSNYKLDYKHNIDLNFESFSESNSFLMLAELHYPELPITAMNSTLKIISVKIDYFDNRDKQFKSIRTSKSIRYVSNKNDIPYDIEPRIHRSTLILNTQKVITDVAQMIRDKRNFNAIALLTTQEQALNAYLLNKPDPELTRDSKLLKKYIKNLYQFDKTWFPDWQINTDFNWDSNRYSLNFK